MTDLTNEQLLRAIALNSHPDRYSELLNEALRRMQPTDYPKNPKDHEVGRHLRYLARQFERGALTAEAWSQENETTEQPGADGWAEVSMTGRSTFTLEYRRKESTK